jgi:adenylate cyclase
MTATGLVCGSCGAVLRAGDKFCHECAAPVVAAAKPAEYKQVTVLFADVVHSMDIAAAVGAERLREIMADLVNRAAAVVQRYGGTVDKFTGDGIMAVFGAPAALEDHAVRACLAALGVQEEAKRLAVEVQNRDGVDLKLRVGLNSGQVIAGEIGSGAYGYTAVGEQVGMAQRMESVARGCRPCCGSGPDRASTACPRPSNRTVTPQTVKHAGVEDIPRRHGHITVDRLVRDPRPLGDLLR